MKISLLLSLCLAPAIVSAGLIVPTDIGLFNTGVDSSGLKVEGNGAPEIHWTVDGSPSFIYRHPAYYNSASANWISKDGGGSPAGSIPSPDTSIYTLSFDLSGFDPSQTTITGAWGTDNFGSVLLNGVATGISLPSGDVHSNYNTDHIFTLSSGFQSGINTIEVSLGNEGGPGALRMEFSEVQSIAVPEPSVLLGLLTASSLGMLFLRRRR